MTSAQPPLLEVRDLHVQYKQDRGTPPLRAVDGVSFTVGPHETLGVVGESGSGKSTIGRAILGLAAIGSGRVLLDGRDITDLSYRARRSLSAEVQAVFQDPYSSLNPARTVGQSLDEMLRPHGVRDKKAARGRTAGLLELVGLPAEAADRFPGRFSGGQRQRIAIARALMASPRLVICDEPVSALDLSVQAQVLNLLRRLQAELGISYIFISHDLSVVRHISQRVLVLYKGRVMEAGRTQRVYERPLHPYTRLLIAAEPVPDPDTQRLRHAGPPDTARPAGAPGLNACPFASRCPHAAPICWTKQPALEATERGLVACHRWSELAHEEPPGRRPDGIHATTGTGDDQRLAPTARQSPQATQRNPHMTQPYSNIVANASAMERALGAGDGIVRLAPAWVPRAFCTPGRRLRLHPDDYFPFGPGRGGIDERWLSSAVRADNGPLTGPYEGLSLVVDPDGALLPFDEFVAHHKAQLIGERQWNTHGKWPMYSKFFDNLNALPFHLHHTDEKAALVGKPGKPEAYYYSPHMNNHLGNQPISFLGLQPEAAKDQVRERLARFAGGGDNRITDLARGYRTQLGTGWDIPPGVLHAPASVATYEPQAACDVFCMCESWSNNREVDAALLWKDVPAEHHGDLDFIVGLLDWELNTDPQFVGHRFMRPYSTKRSVGDGEGEYVERWIVFRSPAFSAKELTVRPGRAVRVVDQDAYGLIVVQGAGTIGRHSVQAATLLRYGQLSEDEFFVSEGAARAGVQISNRSTSDDLVVLKHFGPENIELATDGPWD